MKTRSLLGLATLLVCAGVILFMFTYSKRESNAFRLSTAEYVTNTYDITEDFTDIVINTSTSDTMLLPSEDGKCKVVLYEAEKLAHTVTVTGNTLSITQVDDREWVDHITFLSFGDDPYIKVYLPEKTYEALTVKEDTGDIDIPADFTFESIDVDSDTSDVTCNADVRSSLKIHITTGDITSTGIHAGSIDYKTTTGHMNLYSIACEGDLSLRVDTGKITLNDVTCKDLMTGGDTGDLYLTDVIASGDMTIDRSTGDVTFDGCDAANIKVTTSTGKVKGTLLSDKIFYGQSDTGKVSLPRTTTGGVCEITTDTGDIDITVR